MLHGQDMKGNPMQPQRYLGVPINTQVFIDGIQTTSFQILGSTVLVLGSSLMLSTPPGGVGIQEVFDVPGAKVVVKYDTAAPPSFTPYDGPNISVLFHGNIQHEGIDYVHDPVMHKVSIIDPQGNVKAAMSYNINEPHNERVFPDGKMLIVKVHPIQSASRRTLEEAEEFIKNQNEIIAMQKETIDALRKTIEEKNKVIIRAATL